MRSKNKPNLKTIKLKDDNFSLRKEPEYGYSEETLHYELKMTRRKNNL